MTRTTCGMDVSAKPRRASNSPSARSLAASSLREIWKLPSVSIESNSACILAFMASASSAANSAATATVSAGAVTSTPASAAASVGASPIARSSAACWSVGCWVAGRSGRPVDGGERGRKAGSGRDGTRVPDDKRKDKDVDGSRGCGGVEDAFGATSDGERGVDDGEHDAETVVRLEFSGVKTRLEFSGVPSLAPSSM